MEPGCPGAGHRRQRGSVQRQAFWGRGWHARFASGAGVKEAPSDAVHVGTTSNDVSQLSALL